MFGSILELPLQKRVNISASGQDSLYRPPHTEHEFALGQVETQPHSHIAI